MCITTTRDSHFFHSKGCSRKKYLGGEDSRRYIFLWVVGAESFQIIWVVGVRPNLITFCGRVPWLYQYWPGGSMLFVVLCPGTPEGSTGSGSGFKASQKTGQRLKVSSDRLGEAGNRTCDPWFTRHSAYPLHHGGFSKSNYMGGWCFTKSSYVGGWYI